MDSTGVGLLMNGIGRWDIDMTDEASLREVHSSTKGGNDIGDNIDKPCVVYRWS